MNDARIGIVAWNSAAHLDALFAALPQATAGLRAEVTVVDNASRDDSANVARRFGATVVENRDNAGYGRAMNQALAGTDAPVLIALNPDTVPCSGSLTTLVERILADPTIGLAVPRLRNPDGSVQHSVYRFPSVAVTAAVTVLPPRVQRLGPGARWWLEGASPHDRPVDIDWAIGAVHAIRAEAVAPGPPYRERWFMYVEDLDLCWRLDRKGWRRRLETDAEVVHAGNASGRIAWGDERMARWLSATYDWYDEAHGAAARRRWALANLTGAAVLGGLHAAGALSPAHRGRRRRAAHELRTAAGYHLRALVGSLDVPDTPPGGHVEDSLGTDAGP